MRRLQKRSIPNYWVLLEDNDLKRNPFEGNISESGCLLAGRRGEWAG